MMDITILKQNIREYGDQMLNEAEHSKEVGAKDAQFAATVAAATIYEVLKIIDKWEMT